MTHTPTHTPKAICPINFFKVGGIINRQKVKKRACRGFGFIVNNCSWARLKCLPKDNIRRPRGSNPGPLAPEVDALPLGHRPTPSLQKKTYSANRQMLISAKNRFTCRHAQSESIKVGQIIYTLNQLFN